MLKLHVGFNRKVGEAQYNSRGASVHLKLEYDSGLVNDTDRLRERVRQLFELAKTSVDEELNPRGAPVKPEPCDHEHGHLAQPPRKATAAQVRALHAIAQGQGIELEDALWDRYGIHQVQELSVREASALIDELKCTAHQPPG